jgi:hypothetical protein
MFEIDGGYQQGLSCFLFFQWVGCGGNFSFIQAMLSILLNHPKQHR